MSDANRASWRRLIPLAAICVGLLVPGAATASDRGWGVLENGRLGDYHWTVKAKREGGPAVGSSASRSPCLLVGVERELGPFNVRRVRFRSCAQDSGRLAPTDAPLITSGSMLTRGTEPELTAVGMVVPAAVRGVRVSLAEGGWRTIEVQRLSRQQTSRTGLGRVRYAAFSLRGPWEAQRVMTISAGGRVLWDSGVSASIG